MQIVLFEDAGWRDLLPLCYARAVFELRCGCDLLCDKVAVEFKSRNMRHIVRPALAAAIAGRRTPIAADTSDEPAILINGRLLCTQKFTMPFPSAWFDGDVLVAAHLPASRIAALDFETLSDPARTRAALTDVPVTEAAFTGHKLVNRPWDLIAMNRDELVRQIGAMPKGTAISRTGVELVNPQDIRIDSSVQIRPGVVIDASDGPISIVAGATIMPNAVIMGPCSIGRDCVVHAGAYLREATSIGPVCKVGGEIEGSIFHAFANKQHDGFVGHSYIGEWVNLGADTVTSDLKNTYGNVSVPVSRAQKVDTGQRFVGSIIGDHSKTGICTALTTGTSIGFCSNVVASRPPQFVGSFAWITPDRTEPFDLDRAISIMRTVMSRRKQELTGTLEALYREIAVRAPEWEG